MSIFHLNKFCFCLPLEFGAKWIGFLYTVLSMALFATDLTSNIRNFLFYNDGVSYYFKAHIDMSEVGLSLFLVFGMYLIYGTYEETPSFLMAWMIYNKAVIALLFNELFYSLAIWYNYSYFLYTDVFVHTGIIAILCYNDAVVASLYRDLKEKKGRWGGRNNRHLNSLTDDVY